MGQQSSIAFISIWLQTTREFKFASHCLSGLFSGTHFAFSSSRRKKDRSKAESILSFLTKEPAMNQTQADILILQILAKSRQSDSYAIPRFSPGVRIDECHSLLGRSEVFLLDDGSVIEMGKAVLYSWGCLAAYDGINPTCPSCHNDLSLDGLGRKKKTLQELHSCMVCGWQDPDVRT